MSTKKTPVLIGTAQLVNREKTPVQIDPLMMMAETSRLAAADAGLATLDEIDTLYVVNCLSRILERPAQDLSEILKMKPIETGYTGIGATAPQWFVNRAAERIYREQSELVLICGAEAFYTHEKLTAAQQSMKDYLTDERSSLFSSYCGDIRTPLTPLEMHYGMFYPLTIYALFENALRAHWKKSIPDHIDELASFCAHCSHRAAGNPFSWFQESRSAEEIASVNEENRMVAFPYTKLMCSNMNVNQAAAVILTSQARAEALGIPEEKMIFLRGCADAEDIFLVSERPDLHATPSVADAVERALTQVPLSLDEVEYFDLYSCFPCAPRMVREMLKISPADPRPLTVTGGMASFGGPGNNYALHAISQMVTTLRQHPKSFGLVQALSWFISKHSVGIYSARQGTRPWLPPDPDQKKKYPRVTVVEEAAGRGIVETYTVNYNRAGQPTGALVIGRDAHSNRFLARVKAEEGVLEQMTREEPIGRSGRIEYDSSTSTNWFHF